MIRFVNRLGFLIRFDRFFSLTEKRGGSSFIFTPVGNRISAGLRDYGKAVRSLRISVCIAKNPRNLSAHERLEFKKLPNVSYNRTSGLVQLSFLASHVSYRDDNRIFKCGSYSVEQSNRAICDIVDNIDLIRKAFNPTDQFDVEALLADIHSILATPIKSLQEFEHFAKLASSKPNSESIQSLPDDPEFHPNAKLLLPDPVHWSLANELPPHGSDLTSALLRQFVKEKTFSSRTKRTTILMRLLREFEIDENMSLLERPQNDKADFDRNRENYWRTNEVILAVACGEIKLKGKCDPDILTLALASTRRHLRSYNIDTVRGTFRDEFVASVKKLRKFLRRLHSSQATNS